MSINPVTTFRPAGEGAPRDVDINPSPSPSPQPASVRSVSATLPRGEPRPQKSGAESFELPQDEVRVQRVDGTSNEIVIKYLDASGNVILQIPSQQVLGLARAVEQALAQQASRKSAADQNNLLNIGGTSSGN